MASSGSYAPTRPVDWSDVRAQLRAGGLRWTPQRRTLIDVLSRTDGHVTGAELIERCRAVDPDDDPVDRLPNPRRPRGTGAGPAQPRSQRPGGVPRPARRHPRAPPLHRLRIDLGDPGRRGRGPRRVPARQPAVRRRRDPPVDLRRMRGVLGEERSLTEARLGALHEDAGAYRSTASNRWRSSRKSAITRSAWVPAPAVPKRQVTTPAALPASTSISRSPMASVATRSSSHRSMIALNAAGSGFRG